MRILLIEDEPGIASFVAKAARADGYCMDHTTSADEGAFLAKTNDYDLLITDVNLGEGDGLAVCRDVRAVKPHLPILVLTVRQDTADKVTAFDAGADDYLTKPFAVEELMARVRSLFRREKTFINDVLAISDIVLDSRRQTINRGGKLVTLRTKEFAVLEYLMRHPGIVISRTMLLEHVWDMNTDPFTNTVDVHIRSLRRKINDRAGRLVQTIYGRGYKIEG